MSGVEFLRQTEIFDANGRPAYRHNNTQTTHLRCNQCIYQQYQSDPESLSYLSYFTRTRSKNCFALLRNQFPLPVEENVTIFRYIGLYILQKNYINTLQLYSSLLRWMT